MKTLKLANQVSVLFVFAAIFSQSRACTRLFLGSTDVLNLRANTNDLTMFVYIFKNEFFFSLSHKFCWTGFGVLQWCLFLFHFQILEF